MCESTNQKVSCTSPLFRKRLRIHLLTATALFLAAGVLLFVNMRPVETYTVHHWRMWPQELWREVSFGWPAVAYQGYSSRVLFSDMDSADEDAVIRIRREGEDQYDPMVLVWNSEAVITDATVAVAILVFVLIAGESLARFIFSPAKAAQKTVGRRMETFVTSARASRPCLQFHLSTLVLVSFVAGTLLLVNMEAREARYIVNGSLHNGEVEHYWGYGWPFLFRMKLIAVSTETRRYAVNSREYEFDKVFCFGSVLVNLLILAGAAVALEMARVSGTRTKLTDAGKPGHTSLAEPAKSGDTIHDGEEKKP